MKVLRPLGACLSGIALGLALMLLSVGAVLFATVLNPSFDKAAIHDSGLYDNVVRSTLTLIAADLEGGSSDAGENEIAQAIPYLIPTYERVLTPRWWQTNTEAVIDGLDGWLEGETGQPEFLIDTTAVRSELKVALAHDMILRLPVPPSQDEIPDLANDLSAKMPPLSKDQYSGDDLVNIGSNGVWQKMPRAYWWTRFALCFLAGLLAVITTLVLVLGRQQAKTLRLLGRGTLSNAVMLMVGGAVMALFVGRYGFSFVGGGSEETRALLSKTLVPLIHALATRVSIWLVCLGVGFGLLCAMCHVVARRLERRPTSSPGAPRRCW